MRIHILFPLLALALVAWACPGGAAAYELPQVCKDVRTLQKTTTNPDQAKVVEMYTQCLRGDLSPKNRAVALNNRGNAKSRQGENAEAIKDYDKAIEIRPDYANAYYNRGFSRDEMGDLDGAIADYTRAVELNPKHAKALGNRAFGWKKKGETEKAKADAARALELDPTVRVPTF